MKVHARYFALYRERVGKNTDDYELPEKATVGDLVGAVMKRYPAFCPNPSQTVVAVNRVYVDHAHPLKNGDETAFIPPVSGGA